MYIYIKQITESNMKSLFVLDLDQWRGTHLGFGLYQPVWEGHANFHGHIFGYGLSISDLLLGSMAPSSIPSSHSRELSPSSKTVFLSSPRNLTDEMKSLHQFHRYLYRDPFQKRVENGLKKKHPIQKQQQRLLGRRVHQMRRPANFSECSLALSHVIKH